MIAIIKKKKISPKTMISIWKRARDSSGLSIEVGQFQNNVIDFLRTNGTDIWGVDFNPDLRVKEFKKRL